LSELARLYRLLVGQDLVPIEQHHLHLDFEPVRISLLVLTFQLVSILELAMPVQPEDSELPVLILLAVLIFQ